MEDFTQNPLDDAYSLAVSDVLARTQYGTRTEVARRAGWRADWSNASRSWHVWRQVRKGEQLELDANCIVIYSKAKRDAARIAAHLPALPLDSLSHEAKERGPEQFLSNPRKPGPEEEWLSGEESKGPHEFHDPTHSPYEGDIPPWAQAGWEGGPATEGRHFYVNGYAPIFYKPSFQSFQPNLSKIGRTSFGVGTFPKTLQLGTDFDYLPFAAIPVRFDEESLVPLKTEYLEQIAIKAGLPFARIEVEREFPNKGEVRLPGGKWFPYKTDRHYASKKLYYINAYNTNRYYAGPEEGGWYYDAGTAIASVPVLSKFWSAEVDHWTEYLKTAIGWHSQYELGSVLGHDVFRIHNEESFAADYPDETPHYE